jgi:hypothetical protein
MSPPQPRHVDAVQERRLARPELVLLAMPDWTWKLTVEKSLLLPPSN